MDRAANVIVADALFTSYLQPSQQPTADDVREAIDTALRRWGPRYCAGLVAAEFGDHPDTAASRMAWALTTVRALNSTVLAGGGAANAA